MAMQGLRTLVARFELIGLPRRKDYVVECVPTP